AGEEAAEGEGPEEESYEYGREYGENAGADELALGRLGADVDDAGVVGLLGAGPDRLVEELDAAFLYDEECGAADGADEHRAEEERHGPTEKEADDDDRRRD